MMDLLHDACNNLYEHLVDGDAMSAEAEVENINKLIEHLTEYTSELP
jgi:hypothetical protein